MPKLIAFDLDDTLAPSKSPVPEIILNQLTQLLTRTQVAIISGGNLEQFQKQLLAPLAARAVPAKQLECLHLLPTCGTHYEIYHDNAWHTLYREVLSAADRAAALQALRDCAQQLGYWESQTWGPILEDRGSQITFSALGQEAPVAAKAAWDANGEKKNTLAAAVQKLLPHLEVRSGGSTSVDITRKGIDKAYGMRKLEAHTGIALSQMLFVGDRLDPAGNDYPVLTLGVKCQAVTGWENTAEFLAELLK